MLKSYLRIAYRNLKKQKVFSLINLFGLTTGLACFLLIALYLFDELTYDAFHKNASSIYRVVETKTSTEGKEKKVVAVASHISEAAGKQLPEVAEATRFSMVGRSNISNEENEHVFYESFYFADASFFTVFDFPILYGSKTHALRSPHTVVLTDETAEKLFGQKDAVGKVILTDRDSVPYKITAVIHVPKNSHLQFNLLFSESTLYASTDFMEFFNNDWSSNTFVTYLQLKGGQKEASARKLDALVKQHRQEDKNWTSKFYLQPLRDIHFYSEGLEGNMDKPGNITHIYVFGVVALFVLLIACINYMNLTTARFSSRSKEIAVRKVAGASRKNLVRQFLTETSLMTVVALLLALVMVKLVLPAFNAFTEKKLMLGWYTD